MAPESFDDVLREQVAYYRDRAREYDQWWDRLGRYDRGVDATARWLRERAEVLAAFDGLRLRGDVLELAPGTGIWTERLVRTARSVTAVDASPEMLAINRERLGEAGAKVSYVEADLFDWQPPRRFDAVVFCFWISHVPKTRLDRFLGTVVDALTGDGRLFFVDGKRKADSTAIDHDLPERGSETMLRRLDDGRSYRIVKNFWTSEDLAPSFRGHGLDVSIHETKSYFIYGSGRRRR